MTAGHDFTFHREKTVHDYYHGISGARLRHAALAVLMRVGSCTVDEMWTFIKGRHRLHPSLRYECAKGRAIRIGYGVYRIGDVSPRTRRRIEEEEREIAPQFSKEEYEMHLLGEEERRIVEQLHAHTSR